ncbi:hypothetical protein [Streptomyces sp. CA-251251]|uniref:hypothetical protein n=1 Tax=Streptomyces sp. CA-251251 TaxID=3240063 RepID=UPI003D94B93D
MIPRSRPVINEADIAQQAHVPIATWRRRDAPAFRQRVTSLFPHSRILIYDRAQARTLRSHTISPFASARDWSWVRTWCQVPFRCHRRNRS